MADAWKEIIYENGVIKTVREDAEFPFKSLAHPGTAWAIDQVKKPIVESLKLLPSYQFWPSLVVFAITPKKKLMQRLLEAFNRISYGVMIPFFDYEWLKRDFPLKVEVEKFNLTLPARGVGKFTESFLVSYGISQEESFKTARLMAHVIEYDAFYKWKLLDLMQEVNKIRLIDNPQQEVQRILDICYDRERIIPTYIRPKLKILMKLTWLLKLPSIKKAFIFAVKNVDFKMFELDEEDWYWINLRTDYWYGGKSAEERLEMIKAKGYKIPIFT